MLIPNIIYGIKNKSVENKYKNNLVNVLEQIGRYVSLMLTIFPIGISGFKSAGYIRRLQPLDSRPRLTEARRTRSSAG